jgi:hypothetical protein
MYDEPQLSKHSRDYVKELSALSDTQIARIERVCGALERQFHAEADKEAHQKIRILFQRAAKEWLPFIVYCLTFAPVAGVAIYKIVSLDGWQLVVSWIGLLLLMLIPIIFIPRLKRLPNTESDTISPIELQDSNLPKK